MRKIDGMKFLQTNFSSICVDCVFADDDGNFNWELLEEHKSIFRVRSGRNFGKELKCPQKTCRSVQEIRCFTDMARAIDSSLEFVVHRVDESYFCPDFVGTVALFDRFEPEMSIDFQQVSRKLVAGIDSGVRPRDWEAIACFIYPFLSGHVCAHVVPDFDTNLIKTALYRLWQVGRDIDFIKQCLGEACEETVTRFNVYPSGVILLDDHRSISSFVDKH